MLPPFKIFQGCGRYGVDVAGVVVVGFIAAVIFVAAVVFVALNMFGYKGSISELKYSSQSCVMSSIDYVKQF